MSSSSDTNMVLDKNKVIFNDNAIASHYQDAEDDVDNVEGDIRGGLLPSRKSGDDKLYQDNKHSDLKIDNKFDNKVVINLSKLSVFDLFDTGTFFDKQDPCIEICICDQKFKTERQQDAGTSAMFVEKFEIMVDPVELKNGIEMIVEVYSQSVIGKLTHLGKGSINLSNKLSEVGQYVNISIELTNNTKNIKKGVVQLEACLKSYKPKKDFYNIDSIEENSFAALDTLTEKDREDWSYQRPVVHGARRKLSIKGTTAFSRYNRQFFFPANKSDEFEKIFMSWILITCLAFMITGAGLFIDWGVFCTNAAISAVSQMAVLDYYRDKYLSQNDLGESVGEIPLKFMFFSYLPYMLGCIFFAVLSCLLVVYIAPHAEGSGIPDVKSYLNGVHLKGLFSIRTLFAKAVGCSFSIGSGLIAGREGPIIHVGAILGAAFSQGSSEFFQCRFPSYLVKHFRCTEWKRDFAVMGSALGVAAAFIAPMGAVLFAIEEGATVWRQQLTFLSIYGSCLTSFLTSVIKGFIFDSHDSPIIPSVLFGSYRDLQPSVIFRLSDFPYILLLGIIGGIVGAGFALLQRYTSRWRRKHIRVNKFRTIAEVVFVSLLITAFRFWIPYIFGECVSDESFHESTQTHELPNTPNPLPYNCANHNVNDMGLLFYVPQEHALKWLLHAPGQSIGAYPLIGAVLFYFFFTILVFGIAVPSGLFIPAFVMGACYGRLVGLLVGYNTGNYDMITSYAFLGSASALGGITRVTISVAVIALESTGNFGCSLYCYAVVFIAKLFADSFNIGIYDLCIENKDVPFLVDDLGYEGYQLTIDEIMTPVQENKKLEKMNEKSTSAELLYTRDRRLSDNYDNELATTMAKKENWERSDDAMAAISAVPFVEDVISILLDNPNDVDFLVENKTEGTIHGLHGTIERHILNRLLEKRLFGINAELLHPSTLDSAWPNLRNHDSTIVEKKMGSKILKELGDQRFKSVVIDLRPYIDREPAIVLATSSVRKAHSFIREGERVVLVASPKSVNIIGVVRRHDIMPGSLEATLHVKEQLKRLENNFEDHSPKTNNIPSPTKNVFSYFNEIDKSQMSPVSTDEKSGELESGELELVNISSNGLNDEPLSPRSESDEKIVKKFVHPEYRLEPFEPRFYELLFEYFRNKSVPDNNQSSNKFSVGSEPTEHFALHNRKDPIVIEKAPAILSKKALKRASIHQTSKNVV